MQSVEIAIKELRFAVEKLGFRAAFVRPSPYQGRPIHHPDFYPLWDVAQGLNIPIGIHGGGLYAEAQIGADRFKEGKAMRHVAVHSFEMMAATTSIIMGGIAERFPRLRFGFLEASGGWIAGWLDRMDRHVDDPGMNDTELTSMPSEIFARQCFISFEPVEKTIGLLGDHIGSDHILWGTDYPHSDGFPNAPKLIKNLGLTPKLEANVLGGGARRFYGL
jgi:predicted TIM-barrel fold metal-dependent hydrolase